MVNTLVVLSGKGGVGKTTVSCSLAVSLSHLGKKVGLVDVDVHGPNVPAALRITGKKPVIDAKTRSIEPVLYDGIKVWSMAFVMPEKQPLLWRGELKKRAVEQFIRVINWGELDYMVADLPPGSSEEVQGAIEYLKPAWAIGVVTPSDLALEDFYRIRSMLEHYKIPLLLTILNMTSYKCPHCGTSVNVFGKNNLDGQVVEVPMDPKVAETRQIPDFERVARKVIEVVEGKPVPVPPEVIRETQVNAPQLNVQAALQTPTLPTPTVTISFPCSACEKVFDHQPDLDEHWKQVHEGKPLEEEKALGAAAPISGDRSPPKLRRLPSPRRAKV